MKLQSILAALLVGSGISLSAGGYLLFEYSLVPATLLYSTIVVVAVLFILAAYVSQGVTKAIDLATALGVASIIFSLTSQAHRAALTQIGDGYLITSLDLLQLVGFYFFPTVFILLRVVFRHRLKQERIQKKGDADSNRSQAIA
jgi:hypothetical protein